MLFKNRIDAGEKLARKMEQYRNSDSIILALPRGGVPVAYEIAVHLHLSLDIILSKKIGHPANKEFAIGSVSPNWVYLEEGINVPMGYISEEIERIQQNLKTKYSKYAGNRNPLSVKDKNVILVDDGMATGSSMIAALQDVKKSGAKRVIVAIPVASESAVKKVSALAAEVISIAVPAEFYGVGQFYDDFQQVSDEKVIELMEIANGIK
jgi:predicted phosphoribosyltransferase